MKKTNLIRAAICLSLLIVQFAIAAPVSACSCVMPGSPVAEFTQFDAVFTGKAIAVSANSSRVISLLDRILSSVGLYPAFFYSDRFWGNEVTFAVHKSWKNVTTTRVTVHTGSGGGDCGYGFVQGSDYLVYAYDMQNGGGLGTGICSRTTEISGATEDLAYLNTLPTLPLTLVYDDSWPYFVGTALVVIIVFLGLLIVFRRRRRQYQATTDQPQG